MILFRQFVSTERKLKFSAFDGGLFTDGSRGSASQSLAYNEQEHLKVMHVSAGGVESNCYHILQSLPGGSAQGTYEEANKDDNKEKNRYPNILPCMCTFCFVEQKGFF